MKTYIYQIETISNLHVGSGETNQGVVDNLVQRDAITNFPVINASSLKGALRQHFLELSQQKDAEINETFINHVFGSSINNKGRDTDNQKAGAYRFFDARLLSIPVRSDKSLYLMATCPLVLKDFCETVRLLNISLETPKFSEIHVDESPIVLDAAYKDAMIEDIDMKTEYKQIQNFSLLTGTPSVLLSDIMFNRICDDNHLPVIARNYLDNGQSKNLWYEQVVPRFSRFYFTIMVPDEDKEFDTFNTALTSSLVQIGGNASVGNGLCRLSGIYFNNKK